nr:hypothetical protein [Actinomycetota bacterium]
MPGFDVTSLIRVKTRERPQAPPASVPETGAREGADPVLRRTTARAEAVTLLPLLLVLVAGAEYAARSQAGHLPLLRAAAAVTLTQLLPGVLVWRSLRPPEGWLLEDLALGCATGAALAVPAQVLSVSTGLTAASWAFPLLVALLVLAVPGSRRRILEARWGPLPWWFGVAGILGAANAMISSTAFFVQPMKHGSGWIRQYVDLPYHLALAGELSHRFPP